MHLIQQAVRGFMTTAGLPLDKFTPDQAALYTGLQLEELGEKIQAISAGAITVEARELLSKFAADCDALGQRFKQGLHVGDMMRADHAKLIDADFDLAFVSIGAGYSTAGDFDGAVNAGSAANLAKFPNGQVLRDENGKIKKPAGWTDADFNEFIDRDFAAHSHDE